MIYVSKRQLEEVEYLISQSAQGNHVLFDAETVRRVFAGTGRARGPRIPSRDPEAEVEQAYAVEHHLERLLALPSFAEKRAYLERLEPATFEQVVRTYFNIVENNLYETLEATH